MRAVAGPLAAGILIAALATGLHGAALADDWESVTRGETQAAVANLDPRALVVRCDSGTLALNYSVLKWAAANKEAKDGYLMVMFSEKDGGFRASFPTSFVEGEDDIEIGITGKEAADIARRIGQAREGVFVGVSTTEPTAEMFDRPHPNKIPIGGANAAINATLVACDFEPGPALVGWLYSDEAKMAWVPQGGYKLVATCDRGEIVVDFSVPKAELARQLVGRELAYVTFVIDETSGTSSKYFWAKTNFIASEQESSIGLVGPGALDLARQFREADDNVVVGISTKRPGGTYTKYNTAKFPADGNRQVLTTLLHECGLE